MEMKYDAYMASLILIHNDTILMMQRDNKTTIPYPNYWTFNGGKVEENETSREAAIRELKEETGYVATDPIYFMTEVYGIENGSLLKADRYFTYYDGIQKIACYEGQQNKFLTLNEIKQLKILPNFLDTAHKVISLSNFLKSMQGL